MAADRSSPGITSAFAYRVTERAWTDWLANTDGGGFTSPDRNRRRIVGADEPGLCDPDRGDLYISTQITLDRARDRYHLRVSVRSGRNQVEDEFTREQVTARGRSLANIVDPPSGSDDLWTSYARATLAEDLNLLNRRLAASVKPQN